MYSLKEADGSKSYETDDRLTELESEACPVIKDLIE